jgi:hypothetical protein
VFLVVADDGDRGEGRAGLFFNSNAFSFVFPKSSLLFPPVIFSSEDVLPDTIAVGIFRFTPAFGATIEKKVYKREE